jgi:hypothetical protein
MVRSIMCSVVMLGLCVGFVSAVSQAKTDKKAKEAKITKMDAKKGTVSVKMKGKDKDAPEVEKTFKLAEEIEYMDSTGKVATALIFTSGDKVFIVESEGTVTKMKMKEKAATPRTSTPNSK